MCNYILLLLLSKMFVTMSKQMTFKKGHINVLFNVTYGNVNWNKRGMWDCET